MESWIDALREKCGPLTDAASIFTAQLGVERDPPRGVFGLIALGDAITRHARSQSRAESADDDRMFVELAGAYLALLLCDALPPAAHAHQRGKHRLRLGQRGFFDPFVAIERTLEADNARSALAREVALAEAEAKDRGPIARTALEAERQLSTRGFRVREQFGTQLSLETQTGDPIEVELSRVARAAGMGSDAMLSAAVTRLLSLLPEVGAGVEPFSELAPRLLPRPVGPKQWQGLASGAALACLPLAGAAKLCFVLRYEGRARFVRASELQAWGIEASELKHRAIVNLAARSERTKLASIEAPEGTFVIASTGDGLDAARVLLPGLVELLGKELGSPFLLGIPHRDTLLACRQDDARMVERLEARTRELATRAPHAILDSLLCVESSGALAPFAT